MTGTSGAGDGQSTARATATGAPGGTDGGNTDAPPDGTGNPEPTPTSECGHGSLFYHIRQLSIPMFIFRIIPVNG